VPRGGFEPPAYLLFGLSPREQPRTIEDFKTLASSPEKLHKTAAKQAVKAADFYVRTGTDPHHIPIMAPPD
jgi:hypothetical protein